MRTIILALLLSAAVWPQTERKPAFETASIKMTNPTGGGGHSHEHDGPGLLRASMTLKSYIMAAYNVKPYQIVGGPAWIDATTYDIVAKLERADDNRAAAGEPQIHAALQGLLAERFQLKFHHETKEMPAYALAVAKSGFALKPVAGGSDCGTSSKGNGTSINFIATCVDMTQFAGYLARVLRQPVSDETHLQGLYSFKLEWTPDDLKTAAPSDQPTLPSLFTVLQEKLGLRLETKKVPVEILVVDSAERPSEN